MLNSAITIIEVIIHYQINLGSHIKKRGYEFPKWSKIRPLSFTIIVKEAA
jgi:hypothetical protein